jgi:hypothetical protein
LDATDRATDPLALPLRPEAIAIQPSAVDAFQLQPFSVDTSNDRDPPSAPIESPARLSENTHGAAA